MLDRAKRLALCFECRGGRCWIGLRGWVCVLSVGVMGVG